MRTKDLVVGKTYANSSGRFRLNTIIEITRPPEPRTPNYGPTGMVKYRPIPDEGQGAQPIRGFANWASFEAVGRYYLGTCTPGGMDWQVHVWEAGNLRKLDPRYDLANHSPDGLAWGYLGSGPSQLALAILADALDDDDKVKSLYHHFAIERVAPLNKDKDWHHSRDWVREWVNAWDLMH